MIEALVPHIFSVLVSRLLVADQVAAGGHAAAPGSVSCQVCASPWGSSRTSASTIVAVDRMLVDRLSLEPASADRRWISYVLTPSINPNYEAHLQPRGPPGCKGPTATGARPASRPCPGRLQPSLHRPRRVLRSSHPRPADIWHCERMREPESRLSH